MSASYRLTAFSVNGTEVRRLSLDRAWLAAFWAEGFDLRTADVGGTGLDTTVAALTAVELARVNATARAQASVQEVDGLLDHLRDNALRCCDAVDEVLRGAGATSYFSPWFVIESADID